MGTRTGPLRAWSQSGEVFVRELWIAKPSGISQIAHGGGVPRQGGTVAPRQGDGERGSAKAVGWEGTLEHPRRVQV